VDFGALFVGFVILVSPSNRALATPRPVLPGGLRLSLEQPMPRATKTPLPNSDEALRRALVGLTSGRMSKAERSLLAALLADRRKDAPAREDELQGFFAWLLQNPGELERVEEAPSGKAAAYLRAAFRRHCGRERAETVRGKLHRALRDALKDNPRLVVKGGRLGLAAGVSASRWPTKVTLDGKGGEGLFDRERLIRAAEFALSESKEERTLRPDVLESVIASHYLIGEEEEDLTVLELHPPAASTSPTTRVARKLDAQRRLGLLNADERVLVELRLGSLGWEEIARKLGIPRATAFERHERAMKKLRKAASSDPS
jgi:hypothetical protein